MVNEYIDSIKPEQTLFQSELIELIQTIPGVLSVRIMKFCRTSASETEAILSDKISLSTDEDPILKKLDVSIKLKK